MSRSIDHRKDATLPRMVADALWAHRHCMTVERSETDKNAFVTVKVTKSLNVVFCESQSGDHIRSLTVTSSGHATSLASWGSGDGEGFVLIADAWRAAQAARMLRTIGEPDDIPGDRLELPKLGLIARFTERDERYRLPGYDLLMKRLDRIVSTLLSDFPPDQDAPTIDVGNGLTLIRKYGEGRIMHADHGYTTTYGLGWHFTRLGSTFEKLRHRSMVMATSEKPGIPAPVLPALGNARATRMLQLCGEAIANDPMLTDASGALIAPLLTKHVPELVRVHRESSKHALPQDLERIDEEFAEGMDIVCGAVEQALNATRDASRDELRTQIAFLRSRHPDAASTTLGIAA
jgi:hypothetical protein